MQRRFDESQGDCEDANMDLGDMLANWKDGWHWFELRWLLIEFINKNYKQNVLDIILVFNAMQKHSQNIGHKNKHTHAHTLGNNRGSCLDCARQWVFLVLRLYTNQTFRGFVWTIQHTCFCSCGVALVCIWMAHVPLVLNNATQKRHVYSFCHFQCCCNEGPACVIISNVAVVKLLLVL